MASYVVYGCSMLAADSSAFLTAANDVKLYYCEEKETAPAACFYFCGLRLFYDNDYYCVVCLLEPTLFLGLEAEPPKDGFGKANPLPGIASGLAFCWSDPIFIIDGKVVWYLSSYLRCDLSMSYCCVEEEVPAAFLLLLLLFCILFCSQSVLIK